MKKEEINLNPVIWITNDIEEWDGPDIEYLTYKDEEEKCYIRDVDVFDSEVKNFNVGDYISMSNMINIKAANLWKIVYIFEPDKYHNDPNKCRRMLISENWKTLKIDSRSLFSIKNNLGIMKYILK